MAWFNVKKKSHRKFKVAGGKSGYWASPSGKHRSVAMACFKASKRAQYKGNLRVAKAAAKIGKQALALSKREYSMWKKGKFLYSKASRLGHI